jgi:trypsin
MLLELDRSITTVTPVEYNTDASEPSTGDPVTIFGLGTTSFQGSTPDYLQEATINIVSDTVCDNQYGGLIEPSVMLCAAASGKDSCQGKFMSRAKILLPFVQSLIKLHSVVHAFVFFR